MKIPYPRDTAVTTRFFDRYTVGDLIRIGFPGLLGWALIGPIGLSACLLGFGLAEYTPQDRTLDRHILDAAKFKFGLAIGGWPIPVKFSERSATAENGVVFGVVKVSSVDLGMLSDAETAANLGTVNDLFKSLTYPVKLVSRQRQADVKDFVGVDGQHTVTDHFVTIPVFPSEHDSVQDRLTVLEDRCTEVRTALTAGDMYADRVIGESFQAIAKELTAEPFDFSPKSYRTGGELCRVLYVNTYPTEVPAGWLADVLNVDAPGFVDVVQTAAPIEDRDRDRLQHVLSKAIAERLASENPVREHELGQLEEDIRNLVGVEIGGEPLVHYGVYIIIRTDKNEDLETTASKVSAALGQITLRTPTFRMNQAARTVTPFFQDRLGQTRIVPGTTAAAGFPWGVNDSLDENGIVFGTDTAATHPIVLNRFDWEAGHIARMGKIGSGKSFAAKLEVLRSADRYDDLHVVLIDPKQEYRTISQNLQHRAQRWSPDERTENNTEFLLDSVRQAYRLGHNHDGKTIVVIDEAHRLLNDEQGRQVLGELVREGRDQEIAVTLVTQNASDFTQSLEGRNILRNVDCHVFMRHSDVDVEVEDFFNLSETESVRLRKLRTGTDVGFSEAIIRGPVNTTIRIEATGEERELIRGGQKESFVPPFDSEPKSSEDEIETRKPDKSAHVEEPESEPVEDSGSPSISAVDALLLSSVLSPLLLVTAFILPGISPSRILILVMLLPTAIVGLLLVIGWAFPPDDAERGVEA